MCSVETSKNNCTNSDNTNEPNVRLRVSYEHTAFLLGNSGKFAVSTRKNSD